MAVTTAMGMRKGMAGMAGQSDSGSQDADAGGDSKRQKKLEKKGRSEGAISMMHGTPRIENCQLMAFIYETCCEPVPLAVRSNTPSWLWHDSSLSEM